MDNQGLNVFGVHVSLSLFVFMTPTPIENSEAPSYLYVSPWGALKETRNVYGTGYQVTAFWCDYVWDLTRLGMIWLLH